MGWDLDPSWWPTIAAEPGVVRRAVDLVQTDAARTAARDALFDRVVIIRSLDQALQLWERYEWGAPHGPILVTLDGEVVDASGIVTGGQGAKHTWSARTSSRGDGPRSQTTIVRDGT
ncbi:MAG: hypothetical protein U0236_14310 [Nitrospira sp.]